MLARMSHPMPTYLLWTKENQSIRSSANTHTNKTQAKANVEPECQSLDLHQHPNQNTHTLEPKCHSMVLHQLPSTQQHNKLIGSRGLEPITVKQHTQKKRKGARRDQLNLLPTYFIWYEDQGDVVPLRREKGLA